MQNREIAKLEKEINPIVAKAKSMVISNAEEYEASAICLKDNKTVQKNVIDYWDTLKKSANKVWKDICGKEKDMLGPLKSAEIVTKNM